MPPIPNAITPHRSDASLETRLIAISRKTLSISLGLVTVMVVLANLALNYYGISRDSQSKARVIAENTSILVVFKDIRGLERAMSALDNSPEIHSAAIYDMGGRLMASYPPADSSKQPPDSLSFESGLQNWKTRSVVQIIEYEGEYFGTLTLQVSLLALYWQVLWQLLATLLAGILALWLAQTLLRRLNSSLLKPLRELGQTMEAVKDGRNDGQIHPVHSEIQEFSLLAAGFSQMLAEIEQRKNALQAHQEHLEEQVAQRTADLALSRDAAEQARCAAERANAAKSEFLSRMSHELRTPLNAILGFGQLLQIADIEPDDQESVEEILKAGRHLLDLVNEILDLSRIESGRLELHLESVPICEAAHHCNDLLRPLAEQRQIRLQLPLCLQTEKMMVTADKQRLTQIMLNLLSNAIKYNRDGGDILLDWHTDQGEIEISVQDTGYGIAAEDMARLFRPFERLEGAYNGIEGSGIGLALVKRLVNAMGGTVGVSSTLGQGSRFWFRLPAAIHASPANPD